MSLTQNKYDYLKLGIAGFLSTVTEMFFFPKNFKCVCCPVGRLGYTTWFTNMFIYKLQLS